MKLHGKVKYIIGGEAHVVDAEGGMVMPIGVEYCVHVLEDHTVINCRHIVQGFSVYRGRWEK